MRAQIRSLFLMAFGACLVAALSGCVTKPVNANGDNGEETGKVSTSADSAKAGDNVADLSQEANVEKVKVYDVHRGDNLWNIAARKEVYGNGWLYPLLYRANADLLSHPDKLEKGIKLIVPRGQSATELEAAKEEAMASEYHHNPKANRKAKVQQVAKVTASPVPTVAPTVAPVQAAKPAPAKKSAHGLLWLLLLILLLGIGYGIYRMLKREKD